MIGVITWFMLGINIRFIVGINVWLMLGIITWLVLGMNTCFCLFVVFRSDKVSFVHLEFSFPLRLGISPSFSNTHSNKDDLFLRINVSIYNTMDVLIPS